MNLNNLTIKAQEALQRAQQIAMEFGQQAIELGHLLKGILEVDENVAPYVFKKKQKNSSSSYLIRGSNGLSSIYGL